MLLGLRAEPQSGENVNQPNHFLRQSESLAKRCCIDCGRNAPLPARSRTTPTVIHALLMPGKVQDLTSFPGFALPACLELAHTHPGKHVRFGIEDNVRERKNIIWRK